jgi:hypothetical protein
MTPRQKRPNFSDCTIKTKKFLWELWTNHEIDDPMGIRLLELLGQVIDRRDQARKVIKKHGLLIPDRVGKPKLNPAAVVEKDCTAQILIIQDKLRLDIEPLKPMGRPPVRGNYAHQ